MMSSGNRTGVAGFALLAGRALLLCALFFAGAGTVRAQDDSLTTGPIESVRGDAPRTADSDSAVALERVRSFLRSVMTGRFPDYVSEYVGSGLVLKQGDASRTASAREVGDAIQKTIASGRRQVKAVQVSVDKSGIQARWNSSGTRVDHGETALGTLIDDGDHTAVFVLDKDKIVSIQWQ